MAQVQSSQNAMGENITKHTLKIKRLRAKKKTIFITILI